MSADISQPITHSPGIAGSGCFNTISLGGAVRDVDDKKGPCLLELTFVLPAIGCCEDEEAVIIVTLCFEVRVLYLVTTWGRNILRRRVTKYMMRKN